MIHTFLDIQMRAKRNLPVYFIICMPFIIKSVILKTNKVVMIFSRYTYCICQIFVENSLFLLHGHSVYLSGKITVE